MCIIADVSVFCAVISLVLLKDFITTGVSNVCVAILPPVYSMKPSVTNFCLAREYCCEKHPPMVIIIASVGISNQHSGPVLCDLSFNTHNTLHHRTLNLRTMPSYKSIDQALTCLE